MKLELLLAAAASMTALALTPVASADRVYHSEHMTLAPVGSAPLRSGFVQNVHANGPNVYAHEIYVLNGATPKTTYQVNLLVHPFAPTCTGAPATFASTPLTTNVAGNGQADLVISPSIVPPVVRNATHGVRWTVTLGGVVVYATACTAVTLD